MFTLFVSIGNLVITATVFHILRLTSRTLVKRRSNLLLVEEFLTTFDFCACCCELSFIYDVYGALVFGALLFAMCLWWESSFGSASANANPYLENVIRGRLRSNRAGQLIVVQLIAGSLVFIYMRYLWSFGWSNAHLNKSLERGCEADLQVTVKNGAIVEAVITFIDRLNALTLQEITWPHSEVTSSLLSTFLVIAALPLSGGYFNPILASSLKFGCSGHGPLDFIIVYWIGSIVGSVTALVVHQFIGVRRILELTGRFRFVQVDKKHS